MKENAARPAGPFAARLAGPLADFFTTLSTFAAAGLAAFLRVFAAAGLDAARSGVTGLRFPLEAQPLQ